MFSAIALCLTLATTTAQAALVNVGGVIWDTEATQPQKDFFATSDFDQWFQTSNTEIDSTDRIIVDFDDPDAIVGNYLYGSGRVNNINGVNNATNDPMPETSPANFCPGCEVTYIFGNIYVTDLTERDVFDQAGNPVGTQFVFDFDITNAFAEFYVDDTPDWPQGTRPDATNAMNGAPFLRLGFASFDFTPSINVVGGQVSAQTFVTGGLAAPYFDTNPTTVLETTMLPGADFTYSASSQFADGATFSQGTAEVAGDSIAIPEPEILALFGIGLMAIGGLYAARRQSR